MTVKFDYNTFVTRNSGYVSAETQAKIRQKTLLIAGCGIGSSVAICAARMGFDKFVLVDGDVVDAHNLNRQFYDFADIGKPKVDGLKDKILRINPEASVEAIRAYLTPSNTDEVVAKADIVFDTVDFLDADAILGLHGSAMKRNLELFTALSIGFGAGVLYFPAGSGLSLASLVQGDVAGADPNAKAHYAEIFASVVDRIGKQLDKQVVEQISKALTIMEEDRKSVV